MGFTLDARLPYPLELTTLLGVFARDSALLKELSFILSS